MLVNNKPLVTLSRDNFKDVVVWNPYVEGASSMGDFEPKTGWKNMVFYRLDLANNRFVWKQAM